jgi:hypothetical protein
MEVMQLHEPGKNGYAQAGEGKKTCKLKIS